TIAGGTVTVTDTRPVARAARHELSGLPAAVLMHCDQRASWATLTRAPELAGAAEADLRDAVDALVADGLVARRGNRFVTLAVFRDRSVQHVSTQHLSTRPRYEEALAEDTAAQAAVPQPLLRLGNSGLSSG